MSRCEAEAALCPNCGSFDRDIVESRKRCGGVYRRSQCRQCSARYTTQERPVSDEPSVTEQQAAIAHALARLLDRLTDVEHDVTALRTTILDAAINLQ